MKGAKVTPPSKFKSVVQAATTSTPTPSEISDIMFSISQLANTVGTLITDKKSEIYSLRASRFNRKLFHGNII